ncbi:MAG: PAS domain S-box protein [Magnetospirillum sp.]|nr:PAS domain S-box protein [Magnetospirillum sp.]
MLCTTISLRVRLLALAVVAMAPVALLSTSAVWGLTQHADRLSLDEALLYAHTLRLQLEREGAGPAPAPGAGLPADAAVWLVGRDGVVSGSDPLPPIPFPADPGEPAAIRIGPRVFASVPALAAGSRLVVAVPDERNPHQWHSLLETVAVSLAAALALSLAIAWAGIHRLVLRKMETLEAAAARIRAGELGVSSGLACDPGEFGRLARTFDGMARALDQRLMNIQHTLRESEIRFKQMARAAPTGIFRLDTQLRLTYANPWFLGLIGRNEGEMLGRSWLPCLHPDDQRWVEEMTERAEARGSELELRECRVLRPDGSVVWVLVRDTPERDAGGNIRGRIGTVVDVTTLKQVTEALRDSEERFRKLARIAPVGIFRADADGACTYANDSLAAILGQPKHSLRGRDWRELVSPGAAPPPPCFSGPQEVRLRRGDGREVWVLVTEMVERDSRGEFMGRIGTMADITGQMLAREALRMSEERFRVALKHSPVTVCAYDLDLRSIWMFNGKVDPEWATGRRADEIYQGEDAKRLMDIQREVLATGFGHRDTLRLSCGGVDRVVDIWYEPLMNEQGDITGLVGAAVDITAERRLQEALIQAREEAERANEAKSRFLAAASHDLRQPFQAMRLFRAALTPFLTDPKAESVAAKLDEAMTAGEQLLNTLLDVSTLEAGIVSARPIPVSAADLIERLAREFQPQVEARGLRLRALPRPALIVTDPVLLERMLRNLLHNAVRYTEKGGILIGARRRGEMLVFQVVDTGIGIAPDQQDKVFEDFYQVGNSSRDRSRGLGLGLSVVARTARLLGHGVTLRSAPGRGSVFSVSVPLASARGREAA